MTSIRENLRTGEENTWCPGCPDHMIMESFKRVIAKYIEDGKYKQEDFAISCDIGCHGKIFDYLNLSGVYGLHGRSLPMAMGIKIGNPNLKVIAFAGDGAAYSEGISHFIHSFKYNPDVSLILFDNQSFSLTTGQPTPTSQTGFKSKSMPLGTHDKPINPLRLALVSNGSFIARTNARDVPHMQEIFAKAIEHKGFSFVEVIQDCIIFNKEVNNRDSRMYKVEDNFDLEKAEILCKEYDYNSKEGKIPIGVLFQDKEAISFEDKWPQLKSLQESGVGWSGKADANFNF